MGLINHPNRDDLNNERNAEIAEKTEVKSEYVKSPTSRIKGHVIFIDPRDDRSLKFPKQSFGISEESNCTGYSNHLLLTCEQRVLDLQFMLGLKVGDMVIVEFNVSGRKYLAKTGEVKVWNCLSVTAMTRTGEKRYVHQ